MSVLAGVSRHFALCALAERDIDWYLSFTGHCQYINLKYMSAQTHPLTLSFRISQIGSIGASSFQLVL